MDSQETIKSFIATFFCGFIITIIIYLLLVYVQQLLIYEYPVMCAHLLLWCSTCLNSS